MLIYDLTVGVEPGGLITNAEFEQIYFPKYESVIRAIARKLASKNDSLAEDLFSEGMVALWKLEPSKARDNQDAYIRQAIKYRLVDWIRKERPGLSDSLTVYLERGDQVVQDEDTGETVLLRACDQRHTNFSDGRADSEDNVVRSMEDFERED